MIYKRIRELREEGNMKQWQIARILHCSQQVYSCYETGQRDIPTDILIALAELHQTNVDYILGLTDTMTYYRNLK